MLLEMSVARLTRLHISNFAYSLERDCVQYLLLGEHISQYLVLCLPLTAVEGNLSIVFILIRC